MKVMRKRSMRAYEIGTISQQIPDWLKVNDKQLVMIRKIIDSGHRCVVILEPGCLQILTKNEFEAIYNIVED